MNSEALLTYYVEKLTPRLQRAGEAIRDMQKSLVSTPYPPASTGGNPPHRRSGNLQREIACDEVQLQGTSLVIHNFVPEALVPYAIFLEHGTNRMSPRPFFEAGRQMALPRVRQILAGGL